MATHVDQMVPCYQSHMYTEYNISFGHLEVVMSQQEKRQIPTE